METPPLNVVLLSDREDYIEQIPAIIEPTLFNLTVLRDARPLLENTEFDDSTAFIIDMNQSEAREAIIELRGRLPGQCVPVIAIYGGESYTGADAGFPYGYVACYLYHRINRFELLSMLIRLAKMKYSDREDILPKYWRRTTTEHNDQVTAEQEEKQKIAEAERKKARAQENTNQVGCCMILFIIVMGIFAFKNLFDWISVHGLR